MRLGSIQWPAREAKARGFTLIEILVVIFILGILMAIVVGGVGLIQKRARRSTTSVAVSDLNNGLQNYLTDEKVYPGFKLKPDPERNDFPVLFNALMGEPKPKGPGGRAAPYCQLKKSDVVVEDEDGDYRMAKEDEFYDSKVDKYYLDAWRNPIVYRCNKGKRRQPWMKNPNGVDIYSLGPNGKDDTSMEVEAEKNDDIGNW